MIPQAVVAMLATSRIGAIHSLVFGGFASKELASRINHAEVFSCYYTLSLCIAYSTLNTERFNYVSFNILRFFSLKLLLVLILE